MKRILFTYLLLLILPAISIASDLTDFTGVGGDFKDGGDIAGADRTLGNTDNFDLGFITNGSTRLHIQSDGKIGINTTSPNIASASVNNVVMTILGNATEKKGILELAAPDLTATAVAGEVRFINKDGGASNVANARIIARRDGADDALSMEFGTEATGGALTSRMTIASSGTVDVVGEFTAGTKTFKIDHPLDPTNKILYHGVVESPRFDLIYRGITNLVNGVTTIDIDNASNMTSGTFEALTQNVVVTSLQNQTGFGRIRPGTIIGANFDIIAEDTTSTDTIAWVVMAERHDAFVIALANTDVDGYLIPEIDKEVLTQVEINSLKDITINNAAMDKIVYENVDIGVDKKGYYRHSEAYGATRPTRKVTYTTLP